MTVLLRIWTVAMVTTGLPGTALGFKSDLHYSASLAALDTACLKQAIPEGAHRGWFARGTANEDNPSLSRAWNWHYANNGRMVERSWYFALGRQGSTSYLPIPSPVPFKTNVDDIFEQRLSRLYEAASAPGCDAEAIFDRAGRLAHYIQDMRVPAHVIPVDHGVLVDDGFDGEEGIKGSPQAIEGECRKLGEDASSLGRAEVLRRLAAARQATIEWIGTPVSKEADPRDCRFDRVFWCNPRIDDCPNAPYRGFGSYPASGEPKWGAKTVACGGKGEVAVDYDVVSAASAELMKDTAFMALYAQRLYRECRQRQGRR